MVEFAIVTTQRTGGKFFLTSLDSHPQIQCPGSIFPIVSRFRYFSADNPTSLYRKYRSSSLKRQFAHWFQRKKLIFDCLDNFFSQQDSAAALGFKVSYNHLEQYPAVVDWLREHDVRIIHYIRNNLLKRFLSLQTLRMRGFSHSTQPVALAQVHVNINKLNEDLLKRGRLIEKYRTIFMDNSYLEMFYEDFVANRNTETKRVLKFLGIDTFRPLESDQVKLNPDSIEDIVENYEELVRALKGTAFEKYLTM